MAISFAQESNCFNHRIAGVAVNGDHVLLHRAEDEQFWTFPGGRAEFGETADETLRREMCEELGVEIKVVRPLWFVENFFTHAGKRYHEIALYFLMRLPNDCELLSHPGPFRGEEAGTPLIFQWFSREPETLSELPLLPSFLQTALQDLPEAIERVIQS
ncbi:MAG: NUDIX hydrolase [Blastocatellia bacterium]|nr:NUDIX hydrolase [Blastocatellia bacterium]